MSPEISRRCNSCGASTPEGSMFCPECGKELIAAPRAANAQTVMDDKPPVEKSSAAGPDTSNDASQIVDAHASAPAPAQPAAPTETAVEQETKAENQKAVSSSPTRVERTREKLQHASTVA